MTTGTLTPARPRRVLHGVSWVGYRQERTALAVAAAVLLAVCGWLLFLGSTISDYVTAHHIQGCNVVYFPPECQGSGSGLAEGLDQKWQLMVLATGWLLAALPPALGLFLGAPLLAREFETGTYRLAWTQSVSRRRWLAARLGIPLAVTLVGSTVLATVSTWWVHVVEGRFAVPGYYHWFTWMSRATSGPAMVGFCVVSVAIGAATGLVVRRVVAAMAVTAALTAAVRLLVDHFRFVLLPAKQAVAAAHVTVLQPSGRTPLVGVGHLETGAPLESYTLGNGYLTADGLRIPLANDWINTLPDGTAVCPSEPAQCIAHHSEIVQAYSDYQPPSAEWPMLWTEAGISLVVAAALTAFCFVWIRRLR